jgi:lipid II:glycine glycyltransferase (peptidoglycan interpeptide bridge formation enzyme)
VTGVENSTVSLPLSLQPIRQLTLTWSGRLSPGDASDYDAFVGGAPSGHFAQARWWTPLARAGRPFCSSYAIVRDATTRVIGVAHILRARFAGLPLPYAVIERGPVVADPTLFGPVLSRIAHAARWRGIVRLGVMPYWDVTTGEVVRASLEELGWRSVQKMSGAHAATLRLSLAAPATATEDLSNALDTIFAGSDFRKLRQQYRYAERAGARATRGTVADLPRFVALYRQLMDEQGLHAKTDAWFEALGALDFGPDGSVGLFFTEHEGETVAGALTIRHGRLVTLYLAASDRAPRKFSKMVTCLVAAVAWAQRIGCDFDLGGVPMTGDTDEKRLSIAQFKREFSSTRVDLLGEHARWLWGRLG